MSTERREAVVATARTLHYVRNPHVQALARAGNTHIGAILHDVSDPYFSEIVRGLQRAAVYADRLVMVCNSTAIRSASWRMWDYCERSMSAR